MVNETPKTINTDILYKQEDPVGQLQGREVNKESEQREDNEERKEKHLSDGKCVDINQTKKDNGKKTINDEEGVRLRREKDRLRQKLARQNENEEKRRIRLEKDRLRKRSSRHNEDGFERLKRRDKDRERRARKRELERKKREGEKINNKNKDMEDNGMQSSIDIPNKKEDQSTDAVEENANHTINKDDNDIEGGDQPSLELKTECDIKENNFNQIKKLKTEEETP